MVAFRGSGGYEDYEFDLQRYIPHWVRGRGWKIIFGGIAFLWFFSGVYIVGPDEQGVVRRFGSMVRTASPGIHYHLPSPFEVVDKPKVTQVKRLEIGFRTIYQGPPARYREVPDESLMLTGDVNIVNCQCIIQYRIKDAVNYLFNVRNPEETVRDASEAALRSIIGRHFIEEALTMGKFVIQNETRAFIQEILDKYDAGIQVVAVQLQDVQPPEPVRDAFKDVASAVEDSNRLVNQAEEYRNNVIPKARGHAQQIIFESEGYKAERITKAEGDAQRFLTILNEYQKAKSVTERRLYIETMEDILPGIEKFLIKSGQTGNFLNILPLDRVKIPRKEE